MAVLGGLTWRWTFTPYGRLDWRAALSLHLLTFEYTFKPDPGVFHGFMSIRFFPQRGDALTRTAGFVREHSRD